MERVSGETLATTQLDTLETSMTAQEFEQSGGLESFGINAQKVSLQLVGLDLWWSQYIVEFRAFEFER
ncbi:unnamed protein product [Ilex paraguariensis]|uniref:Uncharacterized protein n=1 Tax=Ilex paraguariensis TaxID=185542 RepID=A0ABC8TLZ0_9AQUA